MPKKKKGKKKKEGGGPSKAELIAQRDELILKSAVLASQLENVTSDAEHLSRAKAGLLMSLSEAEVELFKLKERNAADLNQSILQAAQTKAAIDEEADKYNSKLTALNEKIEAGRDSRNEVSRLEFKVATKQELLEKEKRENAVVESRLEKNSFQVGMQLEECSHSYLHALKDGLKARASSEMEKKSLAAAGLNRGLAKKLSVTSERVSEVVGQFDRVDGHMTNLRREKDFLDGNVAILKKKVEALTRKTEEYEEVVAVTRRQIAELTKLNQDDDEALKVQREEGEGSEGDGGDDDDDAATLNELEAEAQRAKERALEAAAALVLEYSQGVGTRRSHDDDDEAEEEAEAETGAAAAATFGWAPDSPFSLDTLRHENQHALTPRRGIGAGGGGGGGGASSSSALFRLEGLESGAARRDHAGRRRKPGVLQLGPQGNHHRYQTHAPSSFSSASSSSPSVAASFDYGHDEADDLDAIWRK